jgi:hypothetical protein
MRESIFYARGNFPFSFVEPGAEFFRDARLILELPLDRLEAIADRLASSPFFFDQQTLKNELSDLLSDEDSKRLIRLITYLVKTGCLDSESLLKRIHNSSTQSETTEFTQEELVELAKRSPIILREFPGFTRQSKADRLAEATGQPLEEFQLLCDLRPVFNKDRTAIEGILPVTTIRLTSKDAAGLPVSFESVLSLEQLDNFAKKLSEAQQKIAMLQQFTTAQGYAVPSTWLTKKKELDE